MRIKKKDNSFKLFLALSLMLCNTQVGQTETLITDKVITDASTWISDITNNQYNVTIDNVDTQSRSGGYIQNGGSLNINGLNAAIDIGLNPSDTITSGIINATNASTITLSTTNNFTPTEIKIGDGINSSIFIQNENIISESTKVEIKNGSYLNIQNGKTILNGESAPGANDGDTWDGIINVNGENSILDINSSIKNGNLALAKGTINIDADTEFLSTDRIISGNVNVKSGTLKTSTNIENGINLNIQTGSIYEISDKTTNLNNNNDVWDGTIKITGDNAVLNIDGLASKTGNIEQSKGTTNIKSDFEFANNNDVINCGNLIIDANKTLVQSAGTIADTADVTITGNLNVAGGTTTLNSGDTWTGNVNVTDGQLNLNSGITKNGTLTLNGENAELNTNTDITLLAEDKLTKGKLNVNSGKLTTNTNIEKEVSTNIKTGSIIDIANGTTTLNDNDNLSGTVSLSSDNAVLNIDGLASKTGNIEQSKGSINIKSDFEFANNNDVINGGNLVIDENKTLTQSAGTIADTANVTITGNLNVAGGTTTLNSGDTWTNNINISNGTLNITDLGTKNGAINQSGGTINIKDNFNFANTNDAINSGNLVIDTNKTLTQSAGTISDAANIKINGNLDLKGGTTEIGSNDTWIGNINISNNGNLTIKSNPTVTRTGALIQNNQNGGTITIENSFDLNNSNDIISEGTLYIGSNTTPGILNQTNGNIGKNTQITIKENSQLNVNGGFTILDNNDDWNGALSVGKETNDGDLTLSNIIKTTTTTNTFNQTAGKTTLDNSKLTIATPESKITDGDIVLSNDSSLTFKNGQINKASVTMNKTSQELKVENGTDLTLGKYNEITSIENGNVKTDGNITIENGVISKAAILNIGNNGKLIISDTNTGFGNVTVDNNDLWTGEIYVTGTTGNSILNLQDYTNNHKTLKMDKGSTNLLGNTKLDLNITNNDSLTGGILTINDASIANITGNVINGASMNLASENAIVNINQNSNFTVNDLTSIGLINSMNDAIDNHNISNNFTVGDNGSTAGTSSFTFDMHAREKISDTVKINNDILANSATGIYQINVSDWKLLGDIYGTAAPIDRNINFQIFDVNGNIADNIQFISSEKEIKTPIGYYKLNAGANNGSYSLDLTRFAPEVYRGQVATLSQWQNQLAINDMLINHSHIVSRMTDEDNNANKYSAISAELAPYQYSRKEGGLWSKSYGNFEKLDMTRGLNVNNVAYGTLAGADFGIKELANGWIFMPSAYIGYNGAHQKYNGVGIYENGGQLGAMGTFIKDNFITTGLIYGGLYDTEYNVGGHKENTFNYFVGAANKSAYKIDITNNLSFQPSILLSYNFFGKQNWHTDYGAMSMSAGFLNGINVAPGFDLIWSKETFSLYATAAYVYNAFGNIDGKAGNVDVNHLRMDHGYVQYGVGATKSITDRLKSFFQVTVRNGGRNGVGFQGGLEWKL